MLTQKATLFTKFYVFHQPYLIRRKHLRIYFPINKYTYGFPDHLFYLFFTISLQFSSTIPVSIQLATTVVINHSRKTRVSKTPTVTF